MHHANASITRYAIRCWFLLGSKLSVTTSFRSVCTCLLDRSGSGCWSYASTPRPQTCNSNKREPNHPPFWATPERTRVGGGSNGRVAVERRMRGVQPCTSLYSARTRSAWLSLHKVGITKVGITPKKFNSLLLPGQQRLSQNQPAGPQYNLFATYTLPPKSPGQSSSHLPHAPPLITPIQAHGVCVPPGALEGCLSVTLAAVVMCVAPCM
jgi:hypothetical protein